MSQFTSGNTPGFRAQVEADEAQVWWSGRNGQTQIATRKITLDGNAVDAGNSPTTTLRAGLVLAIDTGTGNAFPYDPDANDGKQIAVGILEKAQDMLVDGTATERFTQMLVRGLLKENDLVGLDTRARQQLSGRFQFDAEPHMPGVLMHPRGVARKSTNYTVTAADNGMLFVATAAVNFTLPTKANGLAFRFLQTADANLVITGSSDLIALNSAAASSVTFGTSNAKIGSQVLVECIYTADSTLKWLVSNLGGTTETVA